MSGSIPSASAVPVLQSGDTLFVGVDDMDEAEMSRAKSVIEQENLGLRVVFIIGATMMAAYRPGELGAMETKSAEPTGRES